jgi:hypothetical protein
MRRKERADIRRLQRQAQKRKATLFATTVVERSNCRLNLLLGCEHALHASLVMAWNRTEVCIRSRWRCRKGNGVALASVRGVRDAIASQALLEH